MDGWWTVTASCTVVERLRDRQAERLRGLEVDDQLEFRRLLDGEIGRLAAFEDSVNVVGSSRKWLAESGP